MKILKTYVIVFAIYGFMGFAQEKSRICCTENHKAFNFWEGTWQVTNPEGSPAGSSTIAISEGDCVIRENWKSAKAGCTGTSTNFYNQITGQWE